MRIAFVCHPDITLASFRLRIWMVGDALRDLGHEVFLIDLFDHPGREDPSQYDVVVFAKHQKPEAQADLFARCGGALKVFDCCDDHLNAWEHPALMAHYIKMCRSADLVVTSTGVLAERIKAATQREAVVIPEPLEYAEPRVAHVPDRVRRVFWHGHRSNLDGLMQVIEQLADWKVDVCTNIRDEADGGDLLRAFSKLHNDVVLRSWNAESIGKGHAAADLVLVPVAGGRDGAKGYKGFQRAVEASMLGRMAVVTDLPAYDGWDFVKVQQIDGFGTAIEGAATNAAVCKAMIKANQTKAVAELTAPVIARRWVEAIEGVRKRAAA